MPVSALNSQVVYDALKANGIRLLSVLPETWLVHLVSLAEEDPEMALVRLAKEEEGVGISAGAHLAGVKAAMLVAEHVLDAQICTIWKAVSSSNATWGSRRPAPSVVGFWERRDRGGIMDLEVVEKEVASWAPEEQDRLAAFLTVLRLKRTPDHVQELTRRLDDRDSTNWVSLDEVRSLREHRG